MRHRATLVLLAFTAGCDLTVSPSLTGASLGATTGGGASGASSGSGAAVAGSIAGGSSSGSNCPAGQCTIKADCASCSGNGVLTACQGSPGMCGGCIYADCGAATCVSGLCIGAGSLGSTGTTAGTMAGATGTGSTSG